MASTLLASPVIGAMVAGLLTIMGGLVAEALRRQSKVIAEVREHSAAAREQVQNSHTTNLRDDIDALKAGLSVLIDGQRQHHEGIQTLRTDLAWERRERMDVAARVSRLEGIEESLA